MWKTGEYGYPLDYLLWWVVLGSLILHTWSFFRRRTSSRRRRRQLVFGNILTALCMVVGVGLMFETYLRFVSTASDSLGATLTFRRWRTAFAPTNSLGHRDREWAIPKPKGVRRIAFVGDSFTYGWGIEDPEMRFTQLLQKRFDAQGPGQVEVMNVAWGGWSTRDQLRSAFRVIDEYSVDEVVLCYLPNDIEDLLPKVEGQDVRAAPRSTFIRTSGSFLVDYMYYRIYVPRIYGGAGYMDRLASGFADPVIWGQHWNDLVSIVDLCRERRVDFRVGLLPFLRGGGTHFDGKVVNEQLASAFSSIGVQALDLLPTIQGEKVSSLVVNAHDSHPNEKANALFADAIWEGFYRSR